MQEARASGPRAPRDSGTATDTGSALDVGPSDIGSGGGGGGGGKKKDAGPDVADVPSDRGPDAAVDATADAGASTGLRAFPGAEGFGAAATGGRGGRVIYVTTLAATGPGSLNDALAQTGPRYVLFKVSGVINAEAHVLSGDVTIAGQTSPGGVIVRGFDTTEAVFCDQSCGSNARGVQNIVVRHLRSRPAGGAFPDGLRLRYARNVVIDHFSIGNAADEAVEVSYSNDVTIQNTLLAETVGGHAQYGGMLVNYTNPAAGYALDRLSIHHNTWNRIMGRYPELSRESGSSAAGTTMRVELSNNLLWDQRFYVDVNPTVVSGSTSAAPVYYQLNWVGNAGFAPGSMPYGMVWFPVSSQTSSTTYFADDVFSRYPTRKDYDLNYCCSDFALAPSAATPSHARPERHPFPAITYTPAATLRDYALANVGAFPRDPMDRRLMEPVRAGVIDTRRADANPAGDALALDFSASSPPAAPSDADLDGMPDAWELAHGLDPLVPGHNGTGLSTSMTGVAGYTNLECYLNELSDQRVAGR
ncbi:MAG: hypothetical protein Q8S73_08265 [Deltaproteobacteria bacterium]|nr:hypothetical protein [Myxococcales bacterium]MDP3214083.1 hypothetical protein [Deltaproteobacteria bacterium]